MNGAFKQKNLCEAFNNIIKAIRSYILLTKTTAARNEVALIYHKVRGLYFLAVVFAANLEYISH